MQNFIQELSNYLENNITNNSKVEDIAYRKDDFENKLTVKYRDKILTEKFKILQNYAKHTKEKGEMLYIYGTSMNEKNGYNVCSCEIEKNHEVITHRKEELPEGSKVGSVLRKQEDKFILDQEATQIIREEINMMISQKIEEQKQYLESLRIDGHTYEVGEKYDGKIWLYDLDNVVGGGIEGIEEIYFPKDLYENAKEGDLFVYENGEYHQKI